MIVVLIILIVLAVAAVIVIGLVAVGRLAGQLAEQPRPAVYDRAEAVDFVADRLPDEVTAQLSYDELATLLQWHLDYLEERGVARAQGVDDVASGPLVAAEDDALAFVIGKASESGLEVDDVTVVLVIEGNEGYLEAIGAIGDQLAMPEDPLPESR